MKSPIIKIGRIALDVGKKNKYHNRVGVGGPDWSARHWWWRIFIVRKPRQPGEGGAK
jgi:hypothetical protein